ncbi:hypothetical protein ACTMTI_17055 [Nonomuraea sp. H19]|uniref:hypothetical protein n=1 Tax=Nonomuraea sp. H19 TaxID=3452206 RepID=UPI003F8C106D
MGPRVLSGSSPGGCLVAWPGGVRSASVAGGALVEAPEVGVADGLVLCRATGAWLGAGVPVRLGVGVAETWGATDRVGRVFAEVVGRDSTTAGTDPLGAPFSSPGQSTASSLVVLNAPPTSIAAVASISVPSKTPTIISTRLRRPL